MHFIKKTVENKREDFDNKLKSKKTLRIPGAYNPLTAKIIEEIGYDGVYVSGAVMSNDLSYPDIGLTTLREVSYRAAQIARITNLPTICDADTGFKSHKKTVQTFEEAGIVEPELHTTTFAIVHQRYFLHLFTEVGEKMDFF